MFDNLKISDDFKEEIGKIMPILVKRRQECAYTQKEIAETFEYSLRTVTEFESGRRFNFELFENYCGLFGFEIHIFDNKHTEK